MKTLALFLLLSTQAIGQAPDLCDSLWKQVVDPIEKTSHHEVIDRVSTLRSSIDISVNERNIVTLGILDLTMSCVKEYSRIIFAFEDGTNLELQNEGGFRCNSSVVVFFGGIFRKRKEWAKLQAGKVAAIRVYTMRNAVDIELDPEQSDLLNAQMNCITL